MLARILYVGSLPPGGGGFNNSLLGSFNDNSDTANNTTSFGMCNNAVIPCFEGGCNNISIPPGAGDFITSTTILVVVLKFNVRIYNILINHINTKRYTFLYPDTLLVPKYI